MDFDDSPEDAAFRAEARNWLSGHADRRSTATAGIEPLFEHGDDDAQRAWVKSCCDWQAQKYSAGFGAITWPEHWGGRGGRLMEELIFNEEESQFDVPSGALVITLGMVGPTLLAHGTDAQRQQHLPSLLGGETVWCQLFSEPNAGSDLAGIRTRARRDGDDWIVTGQKVWTSGAQHAAWGYLLARSDVDVPKHKGLTAFLLPMDAPGVTVRPLMQMTGSAHFNEVFFDEVRIPDASRLDAPGAGWTVALTTLMNERLSASSPAGIRRNFAAVLDLVRQQGRALDPTIRQRIAQLHTRFQLLIFVNFRVLTAVSQGRVPGPEGSIAKLLHTRALQDMADLVIELAGPQGTLDNDWSQLLLGIPGARIGGGTDEVLRNVIGERVLRLPPDHRPDRDIPFADLLRGEG